MRPDGDPLDPVSFERALRELWERLADHQGLSLREHQLADDPKSPEEKLEWGKRDEAFALLRAEAHLRLQGLIIVEELRAWVSDGDRWKRPTRDELQAWVMNVSDEPWGVYVDRQEVAVVFAARWPEEFAGNRVSASAVGTSHKNRKVGRPKGPGYALKDVPVFELILEAQRRSGDVETQHSLVTRFADQAEGASLQANVDRLRKGLPIWLEKNGHKWRRSN